MTESRSTTSARPPLGLPLRSLLRADSIVMLRSTVATVLSLLLPIVILVATTLNKVGARLGAPGLVISLAVTIGLITSSLLGYTLALSHDRDNGVLQRLRVTPAPSWLIMASRLAVQIIAAVIASAIVLVVGIILHGLTFSISGFLLALVFAALGAGVFLAIGQAIVGLVRSSTAVLAISRLLFVVLMLVGLVGGSGVLGDTMKVVAEWTPVWALITLVSDSLSQAAWASQDWYALLACFGYIIVFSFIGIRWFRWDSR